MEESIASRLPISTTLKAYYGLTKPGIIRGNALTAAAGYFLAARGTVSVGVFVAMLTGLSLIIASGCVCNNYIDQDIDSKMTRTRNRALVNGRISGRSALLFALILGVVGAFILAAGANLLAAALGVFGFVAYVAIYGVAKRRSVHGTVIGSISGAIPPVVGYAAASGRLDLGALFLFAILVFWQMPHFYAIAMYRLQDYQSAGIPVLPAVRGVRATKYQIVGYIIAFIISTAALTIFGYSGIVYVVASVLLGFAWLYVGLKGIGTQDAPSDTRWARKMFGFSLLVITGLCLAITVDSFLSF